MNTGNRFGGDPALGAWLTYGLGTENKDLPGFMVLPELSFPQGGPSNWSNGFLPASYQGTTLRPSGSPILDLKPVKGNTPEHQRRNLDLLKKLNQKHLVKSQQQDDLSARISSYELAFRMQMQVPEILDLSQESQKTRQAYGVGTDPTDKFGRKCLLARRLVERGVRFVQLYAGTWDSHDYIAKNHAAQVRNVDRPIGALIADLKQRGLLDSTLVIWGGEFGRTPTTQKSAAGYSGRDHNMQAFTSWMAGGGVKGGTSYGRTDEFGHAAVENPVSVHDFHATILHLLGLHHQKLFFQRSGLEERLTGFEPPRVVEEIVA